MAAKRGKAKKSGNRRTKDGSKDEDDEPEGGPLAAWEVWASFDFLNTRLALSHQIQYQRDVSLWNRHLKRHGMRLKRTRSELSRGKMRKWRSGSGDNEWTLR